MMNNSCRVVRLLIAVCVIAATGLGCITSTKVCAEECCAELTSKGEVELALHPCNRQKVSAAKFHTRSSAFRHLNRLDQRRSALSLHCADRTTLKCFLIGAGIRMRC